MIQLLQEIGNVAQSDSDLMITINDKLSFDELLAVAKAGGAHICCKATDNLFAVKAYRKKLSEIIRLLLTGKLVCLYTVRIEKVN